jgi:hypothetical protein
MRILLCFRIKRQSSRYHARLWSDSREVWRSSGTLTRNCTYQSVNDLESRRRSALCTSLQEIDASDERIAILHWFWLGRFTIDEQELKTTKQVLRLIRKGKTRHSKQKTSILDDIDFD